MKLLGGQIYFHHQWSRNFRWAVLVLMWLCYLTLGAFNQLEAQSKSISFGVYGGSTTLASETSETKTNFKRQWSYGCIGLYTNQINSNFSVRTGLSYLRNGAKVQGVSVTDNLGDTLGLARINDVLHYVALPFNIVFHPSDEKGFYFLAGCSGSYLLKQKRVYGENYGFPKTSVRTWDMYKPWDLSLIAGAGYKTKLTETLALITEVTYQRGMINVINVNTLPLPIPDRQKNAFNQAVLLSFRLALNLNSQTVMRN